MWSSSTSSGYNYEGAAAAAVDGGGDQYGHHHLHDLNVVDIPNSLPPSTCATDPNFNTEVVRSTSSRLRPLIPKPSPYIVSSSTTPPAINIITSTFHPHASHHHHLHHSGSSSQDQDEDQDQDYNNNNNNSIKDKEPQQFLHYYHPTSTCPMMTVSAAAQNQQQQQVTTTMTSSRWNPTPEQLQTLEELYRRGTRTPSTEQIQHITSQLSKYGKIEGKNVFYWFQNHKARERQKRRRRELDHHHHHQYQRRPSLDEGPSNFINLATTRHERSGGAAAAVTTEGRVSSSRFEGEEKMETRTWLPSTTHCSASIAPDSRQQEIAGVMSTQSAAAATDAAAVISTEGRRRTNTNTNNSSMKDYYYFYKQPIDLEAEEGHHHHDDGGENVIRFDDDDDDDDDFRHDIRPASTPTCTTTTGGSRGWNDTWQGQNCSTFCGLSSCCGPTVPLPTASANMIGLDQYGMDMNSTFKASSTRNSDDHHQDYCATLELFPLKAQHMKNQEHDHQEGGLLHGGSDDTDLMRTQQIHFYEFL